MDSELAKYFLPEELLSYFNLVAHNIVDDVIHFYLEEKNIVPEKYSPELTHSKGFHKEITVEDFPLRGKPLLLHIKRRRWTILESKEIISREWNLIAKGTRITRDFAIFLKCMLKQIPC